jgi:hypothetical protein
MGNMTVAGDFMADSAGLSPRSEQRPVFDETDIGRAARETYETNEVIRKVNEVILTED